MTNAASFAALAMIQAAFTDAERVVLGSGTSFRDGLTWAAVAGGGGPGTADSGPAMESS